MRNDCINIESRLSDNLAITGIELPGFYLKARRLVELVIIILIIPVLFILMLVTAIPVFICFRGRVIFKQKRVGINGNVFTIYKFRTMDNNSDMDNPDTRICNKTISNLGKFLRKHRIDELPQFINILRGDMGLIGPRPETISQYNLYSAAIPNYWLRKSVPQGITGWSQVNHPPTNTINGNTKKLVYDLEYIANISFKLDVKIIYRTIILVFKGKLNK